MTSAFRDSYFPPEFLNQNGVALASARAGNAIGGGDWTSFQLIPDLMRAFMAGEPCLIRNPLSFRPWQFVLEPLRGYRPVGITLEGVPHGRSRHHRRVARCRRGRPGSSPPAQLTSNRGFRAESVGESGPAPTTGPRRAHRGPPPPRDPRRLGRRRPATAK